MGTYTTKITLQKEKKRLIYEGLERLSTKTNFLSIQSFLILINLCHLGFNSQSGFS